MTSTFVEPPTARQSAAAKRRADYHEARIRSAGVGGSRERLYVLAWLQSELAHGGSLDELLNLIRTMNGRSR